MCAVLNNNLIIRARRTHWVIPMHCDFLTLLFEHQAIAVSDLQFSSQAQRKDFVKQLFLLALQDEVLHQKPSALANVGRALLFDR